MPRAFILWPFFATIKSAHSTLPYATGLKHTRPIVNHLPCLATLTHHRRFSCSPSCSLSRSPCIIALMVSLRATCCTHARTHRMHPSYPPLFTLFPLRTHALVDDDVPHKVPMRIVHERDLRARTNLLPRRFTIDFENWRIEKERESRETILQRRMCENRRCAFNGHSSARHHHWSRFELLREDCRKLQVAVSKNMNDHFEDENLSDRFFFFFIR